LPFNACDGLAAGIFSKSLIAASTAELVAVAALRPNATNGNEDRAKRSTARGRQFEGHCSDAPAFGFGTGRLRLEVLTWQSPALTVHFGIIAKPQALAGVGISGRSTQIKTWSVDLLRVR
jgi:hypothetical protein